MKEIGGYFEVECGQFKEYHKGALKLNSARNALRYLIRAYNIKNIFVPYYICPVVWQSIYKEKCKIIPYDIDYNFMPEMEFKKTDFILYTNWFGICDKNIDKLAKKYPRLIIDNAQGFYSPKKGFASFYSPRKFFGLPDGGLLLCNDKYKNKYEQDISFKSCIHLLKRLDMPANVGYEDFKQAEFSLNNKAIKLMSNLTCKLMGNINYSLIKKIRLRNFNFLHKNLKGKNFLKINLSKDSIPMVYPYYTEDIKMREKLIKNKIYIARYWPIEPKCKCLNSAKSKEMADKILPLPIDQRYNLEDMKRVINIINRS